MENNEFKLRVDAIETAAEGVVSLRLSDPDGKELPDWQVGAHIDIVISEEMIRQYSLCGDPQDKTYYRLGILNEVNGRGGSKHLNENLRTGDELVVRGPRNNFELLLSKNYIFIAGGIGITPIMAMVQEADRQGANWKMLYGGRTATSMAFIEELTSSYGDRVVISPEDQYGLLDLTAWVSEPVDDTLVYCCGPEPLLQAVEKTCENWPKSLHVERFTNEVAESADNDSFDIILAKSGKTLTVPTDKSILQVLQENKIPVMSSCSSGTCGSCETGVLEGTPDHRDIVLDEEEHAENDCMMVCVSRAKSKTLTLDI